MNSLTRDLVTLTAVTLAVVCAVGTIFLASAQPLPTSDPEICATPTSDAGGRLLPGRERAAMAKMMAAMAVQPSGDVDADFVAMMIPHHQGAIDMAQAELRYGRNEQLRRMAQEIIVTQQQEIAVMRLAIGQPLPRRAVANQAVLRPSERNPITYCTRARSADMKRTVS